MKQHNHLEWLQILAYIFALLLCVFAAAQRDALKQEAVDKGFAEWHIVSGTKETEFKWKEPIIKQ
jgi:hypothetical protein